MRVNEAEPLPMEPLSVDEVQDILVRRDRRRGKILQQLENDLATAECTESEFADNDGVLRDRGAIQEPHNLRIGTVQMIDPHRGVDEDQGSGCASLPRSGGGLGVTAAKQCQPSRALALDQSFEPLSQERRLLCGPTQLCGFVNQSVIQGHRRSHASILASNDAVFDAILLVWQNGESD